MRLRAKVIGSVFAVAAWGCAFEPQGPVDLVQLDPTFYAASVQPMVGVTCATLDCHGVAGRPLRLYAEDGLRSADALRGEPLSPKEVAWNVDAFEAIDPFAAADESLVLLKPLAVEAGGLHHIGDPVWATRDEAGYRCLRVWLTGALDPEPCREAAPPEP